MSEELLPWYNTELAYARRMAARFAAQHPKIAGRLSLGPDASEDPHVERLIQSFAFLNARTRAKLDDEFPEITEALLGVLYPHYQAPVPSMSVVEFTLAPEHNELVEGKTLPAGSVLETDSFSDGETCRFRTCYPVVLWPVGVEEAVLARPPFPVPKTRGPAPKAVLKLVLRHTGGGSLRALRLDSLRFFLAGQDQHANLLLELLSNHVTDIALCRAHRDAPVSHLDPRKALRPVGFGRDEGMVPYPARSFLGYRLLTEFFLFPQKYLFLDLALGTLPAEAEGRLEWYFFLDRDAKDIEPFIDAAAFRLGCSPVSNLYRQRCDPIALAGTEYETRIVPDARRPLAHEVHSVEGVAVTSESGEEREFAPFFSVRHGAADEGSAFWQASRRPAETGEASDRGTEVWLSLVDLSARPAFQAGTLHVEAVCLNRDLPERLPFGGGEPRLHLTEGGGLVSRAEALLKFTPTLRPARKKGLLWRLVSHLALNHLSLMDGGDALREVLKLYDFSGSPRVQKLIAGVKSVQGRPAVARPGGVACRGVEAEVLFDEAAYSSNDLYLFASVLERFFALYCTINSFTRTTALVKGGERVLRRWEPRAGEKPLS
ncbi:MAG: type VI secretion system baseplate subunit TssF [Gemmataceae bacterium]|nr:type VI secretion system baseplate subunit TssF [Gemmataceae bacterium]